MTSETPAQILRRTIAAIEPADEEWARRAEQHQALLTQPPGALGRLLELGRRLAAMTRQLAPPLEKAVIFTLAGDHGVAREGVSAFPAEVTAQMVRNFAAGGAAINVLARLAGAELVVADLGVDADLADLARAGKILDRKVARGTANLAAGPAMSRPQAEQAVAAGIGLVEGRLAAGLDAVLLGEMGIGNTTPAAAIAAALTGRRPAEVAGRGTGLDDAGLARKVAVLERALAANRPAAADPLDVLAKVGGFEIGGLAGVALAAAARRKPVLVDGLIAAAGAALAAALAPAARGYFVAAHLSVERGHRALLEYLGLRPLLDLELRLGEGTGAALALPLLRAASRIMAEMATFESAGVAGREG